MKWMEHLELAVLLFCGFFLFAQTGPPPTQQPEAPASSDAILTNATGGDRLLLDGTWEGDLAFLQGATLSQKGPATSRYRISIQGSLVHVYIVRPQDVREIKPGAFHIERLMTNAVIYAIDSGMDNEGTWVESWVFAVTQANGTSLLTNFARVVNNIDLPLSNDHSKFAKEAAGELKLIPASSSDNFGLGRGGQAAAAIGPLTVLTDTQGVDFGPYLKLVVDKVRQNWYNLIPVSALPPIMRKGKVSIEFAITKDGRVAGMQIVNTSGDVALDRAAYGGITSNNPFPPLPAEFTAQYLGLRLTFRYNPDRSELAVATNPTSQPAKSGIKVSVFPHDTLDVPVGGSDVVIASVQGTKNPAVTWRIEGSGCSGTTCGTIDDEGLYHAPSTLPNPPSVTVTAFSQADPTASASVTVHLIPAAKPSHAKLLSMNQDNVNVLRRFGVGCSSSENRITVEESRLHSLNRGQLRHRMRIVIT